MTISENYRTLLEMKKPAQLDINFGRMRITVRQSAKTNFKDVLKMILAAHILLMFSNATISIIMKNCYRTGYKSDMFGKIQNSPWN